MVKHGDWFWHELMTSDAAPAAAFYEAVLGWRGRPMEGTDNYTQFLQNGAPTGGVMTSNEGPPNWLSYVAVRDIEAAKAAVEAHGGTVLAGPSDAPGIGQWMVCQDPQGGGIALIQPAGGVED